jgi:hypothetical protein
LLKLKDKEKIIALIGHIIRAKKEIKVSIADEEKEFTSRIIKISLADPASSITRRSAIIIDKLHPDMGNRLIQSVSKVTLSFSISDKNCRCSVDYLGISSDAPYFGFFLKFPEAIEIEDKRIEERISFGISEFVSAEFTLGKGSKKEKRYELNVMDCSRHGLGLIITQKDFDLLKKLNIGDRIEKIMFFAPRSMIKVNGNVRHLTKIESGEYKGCYQMGIKSDDLINTASPKEEGREKP